MTKRLNQRGFVDVILIVVVAVLIAGLGGYIYHRQRQNNQAYNAAGGGVTVATNTKKTTSKSTATGSTAGWVAYTSTAGHFSLKYPKSWVTTTCSNASQLIPGGALYLAPTADALAKCNSDFLGQMSVIELEGGTQTTSTPTDANYSNVKSTDVTVGGVTGKRVTGTQKVAEAVGPPVGTVAIVYTFQKDNRFYAAIYQQYPSGATSQNVQSDFDTMVQKTLTFTN